MMHSNLRQTTFHINRLENVVGLGRCSAYQIYTSPGENLGQIGAIVNPGTLIPANEEKFLTEATDSTIENALTSWFRRALAALKS